MNQTMHHPVMSEFSPSASSGESRLKPRKVLYADDMPELRHVITHVLGREGHDVECTDNGAKAWAQLADDPGKYDLLITDHHMPLVNGLELVRRARSIGFSGKIVVFSSELSKAVERSYRELDVDHFMMKPIRPPELRQVMAELWLED